MLTIVMVATLSSPQSFTFVSSDLDLQENVPAEGLLESTPSY